jgi:hypothetical protein
LAYFGHHTPDSIQGEVLLNRGIKKDMDPSGKLLALFPEEVRQGNFGQDGQGDGFIAEQKFNPAQPLSRLQESIRIFSKSIL